MDINRASLDALFTGYNQAFKGGMESADVNYAGIVTEVTSGTAITEFPFLEQRGGMREWIGPRQIQNMSSRKLTVKNRTFEDTVSVPVNDIQDDQFGVYTPMVSEMGMNSANIWGELAFAALVANGNWLDDVAFFSTAGRSYDGTNAINNYGTGALTATTYAAARVAMMSYLGHGGKPLNVVPDTLVVGPALQAKAFEICQSPNLASTGLTGESTYVYGVTAPNPWYNTAKVIISTQLVGTYANYWYLMCTKRSLRPIVLVKREEPKLVRKDRAEDDNVFFQDQYIYGTKARGEAALAMPHLCFGNVV